MEDSSTMGESAWEMVDEAEVLLARYTGVDENEGRREMILRYIASISPHSPGGQAAVGGGVGIVAGYLLSKIGKTASFTIGCGLLSLQLAHYYGYVKVDWAKVHKDLSHRGTEFVRRTRVSDSDQRSVVDFVKQNIPLSGGFAGGFFLGMAFS